MSYQVLARKYRPQRFCEVVGQEHITTTLKNALATKRLHHAYLFTGVRGVGKTTVARILAKALNCTNPKDSEPCGKCTACIEITEGRSMDVQEIDGASNTGVDDVREIRERAKYMPSSGRYKIYIIDEVHMLSTPAFNALLKTLEEPPPHVVFIFATTESHKIPATILSRCQRYDFRRIPAKLTAGVLARIAKSENVEISNEAVDMIARESTGSLRDAQSLFDQAIAFAGNDVEADSIKSMLGCLDRTLLFDLVAAALEQNADKALSILDQIFQTGADLVRFASDVLEVIRHMLVLAECGEDHLSLDLPTDEIEALRTLTKKSSAPQLHQIFSLWYSVAESVSRSPFPKMLLEIGLIRLCKVEPVKPIEEIVAKLDSILEDGMPLATPASVTTSAPAPMPADAEAHLTFEPAQRSAGDIANERRWQEFMRWVAGERPQAAAILQQASLEKIDANTVNLRFANAHYAEMLIEEERMQKACELLSTFFKRPMELVVNTDDNGAAQQNSSKQAYKKKKELMRETLKDEIISQAADILGAKLHDVKVETGE
ncbi:MAG: DNA polymerase III subunit gamma/tau [Pseudomonadota bacterium]